MTRQILAALAVAALTACGSGDRQDLATADSLNRDLQLAPVDTTAVLNDAPAQQTPPAATPARPAPTKPAPRPTTTAPAPSAAAASATLASGTVIRATVTDTLSSRTHKPGQMLRAAVSQDITDSRGRVVIPAGSILNLQVTELKPAENKSAADGTLVLALSTVVIKGETYNISGSVDSVEHFLKGRGVTAGDAAKVGAGAAAGAIAGRIIGGKKATVIGGVVGAAAGTAVAVETADRDVVVPAGAKMVVTLTGPLTVTL